MVNGPVIVSVRHSLFINHHHHHLVVPPAQISLTFSRHLSLSFIASGRSSRLNLISSQSCWSPCFARLCEGVHRRASLISSSLLLQQCPACLVCLTLIVIVMGSWWPYSCYQWCLLITWKWYSWWQSSSSSYCF